jgi:photosystem II stability/assembly factor-like uncharacterized protein
VPFTNVLSIAGVASDDVWLSGEKVIAHCIGTTSCSSFMAGQEKIPFIWPEVQSAWVLGATGAVYHCSVGGCNNKLRDELASGTEALVAAWSSEPGTLWAVGAQERIFYCSAPLMSACSFIFENVGGPKLNAVWGSSDNDVYAVGDNGVIVHCSAPTLGKCEEIKTDSTKSHNAIDGTAADDIWVAGDDNEILRCAAGACKQVNSSCSAFATYESVWASARGEAWFAGESGNVLFLRQ